MCTSKPAQRGCSISMRSSLSLPPAWGTPSGNSINRAPDHVGPWHTPGCSKYPRSNSSPGSQHQDDDRPLGRRPPSLSPVSSPRVGALPVRNSFDDLIGAGELMDLPHSAPRPMADLNPITRRFQGPISAGGLRSLRSALGLVSRASPVQTAVRNCTRDEGGPFGFGDQVADPKPPQAAVVKSHGGERCGNAGTMIPAGTVERGERKRTVSEVSKAD